MVSVFKLFQTISWVAVALSAFILIYAIFSVNIEFITDLALGIVSGLTASAISIYMIYNINKNLKFDNSYKKTPMRTMFTGLTYENQWEFHAK